MTIEVTEAAKKLLSEKGYDPVLGARPLRRAIQRDIEDQLSEKILFGEIHAGQKIIVDAVGEGILGEFTFKGVPKGTAKDAPVKEPVAASVTTSTSGTDLPAAPPVSGGYDAGTGTLPKHL
jgi:ATP-dependent Clp protease ATP-binding subunit ClpC